MSYIFIVCSSLTSLNLSNFNTNNVTGIWKMFAHIPKNFKKIHNDSRNNENLKSNEFST